MTITRAEKLRFLQAVTVVMVLHPLRKIFSPIFILQRRNLARLVTACGYTFIPGNNGEIRQQRPDGISVSFTTLQHAGRYGFMGQSGLPADLNLTPNQYDISIKQMRAVFTRMLHLADSHEIDHANIIPAFDLACALRHEAELRYAATRNGLLTYEDCLQIFATHGAAYPFADLLAIANHADSVAKFNEIVALRPRVPGTILYDLYPAVGTGS